MVDNTLYLTKEYFRRARPDRSRAWIVRRALLWAGGGMIQASASLLFGFLLSFSQAVTLVYV